MIDFKSDRSSGVLLHVTSLPGEFGIGDLGPSAHDFVDRLSSCSVQHWQMLPLGPTGYGNSPYSARSTFAGSELLISPDVLGREGLLSRTELSDHPCFPEDRVDYSLVRGWKLPLLKKAARRALGDRLFLHGLDAFRSANSIWLQDYALFMVLCTRHGDARWQTRWSRAEGLRDEAALSRIREESQAEIQEWEALQYIFDIQCKALGSYARSKGVTTIGDIPIFVGGDSADAWSRPELFKRDASGFFSDVSGVPPDNFSVTGQLWGTPVYDWSYHEATGFEWWISRVRRCLELNDMLRIDHFRGFDAFYDIPAGSATAESGVWTPAPGEQFFRTLRERLGNLPIIAEDLGNITESVEELRVSNGFPGMKIAQFGFVFDDIGGFDHSHGFLPLNYGKDYVAYTGTHDNDTTLGWFRSLSSVEQNSVLDYLETDAGNVTRALVSAVMDSKAALAVIQMQDLLGLDGSARMNFPSTCNDRNWSWRMLDGAFSSSVMEGLSSLVLSSGRKASAETPESLNHV